VAKTPVSRWSEHALGAGVILFALAAVELTVRTGRVNPALIPAPSAVAQRVATIVARGELFAPLGTTLYLLFIAYFVASALAVVVGLLMGRFVPFYNLLEPLVEVLRPLPKPALLPPLILFLGLGDTMKLTVIGLGVFFPVLINTVQGVRGVEPTLVDTGRTFRCGRTALLLRIVLPAAMPFILAGMRIALGLGLILVVIAEMLAGNGGLGYLIIDMQRSFRVQDMYAWIVILALLGYALNALFLRIEKHFIHWALARPD
jgi:ABC-type nitrate/sulfonate/bicarbonate transport system permease component